MSKFRNVVCFLLVGILCSGLGTCNYPIMTVEASNLTNSDGTQQSVNQEVQKAIDLGLVPESLQADGTTIILYSEYIQMLRQVINEKDSSCLAKWDQISGKAAKSTKEMKREDAIVTIL